MSLKYMLDTNAYHHFFSNTHPHVRKHLETLLLKDGSIKFFVSEITSMEIYSVLGKDRRGVQVQEQLCTRVIKEGACTQTWVTKGRKGIRDKIFKKLVKLVSDIHDEQGPIEAKILPLDAEVTTAAKDFLINYADRFNFGSQDALIAATAQIYSKRYGFDLIIVTSDKGLKAALSAAQIPHYDPLIQSQSEVLLSS